MTMTTIFISIGFLIMGFVFGFMVGWMVGIDRKGNKK